MDIAPELKAAFEVFEREKKDDVIEISQLGDCLRMTNLVITETFLEAQRKRLKDDEIPSIDWNLFAGIYSAASGEVLAEDTLGESLKTLEVAKIFEDGTIGRRIKTSHLREFLTTFGDDPLTEEEAQELIQDMDQLLQGEVQSDAVAMELVHGMPLDEF
ncbi:Oidioi.mRNA.OKI2018_I69.XSR.g14216.t2.cds [Oikopleura dioica]|nr:Oidioi.mRNA.OKI2018_I69.XSR.g14216.t2.cds [Oikopleura dioica]